MPRRSVRERLEALVRGERDRRGSAGEDARSDRGAALMSDAGVTLSFMSDVVAVGAITASATVLASTIGAVATYKVSRANASTAVRTVEEQSKVELAKITAENERLREEHREAERQNRQATYHRLLAVLNRLDSFATGYAPSDDQYDDALAEWNLLHGGVLLFGTDGVKEAIGPVVDLLERVGAGMDADDKEGTFARSYLPLRREMVKAQGGLVAAMAADVGAGIHTPG
jgi:hypothetical protein